MWRQGIRAALYGTLGRHPILGWWSLSGGPPPIRIWSFEGVAAAHYPFWAVIPSLCLALGLLLELFRDPRTGEPALDFTKMFGIHIFCLVCFALASVFFT